MIKPILIVLGLIFGEYYMHAQPIPTVARGYAMMGIGLPVAAFGTLVFFKGTKVLHKSASFFWILTGVATVCSGISLLRLNERSKKMKAIFWWSLPKSIAFISSGIGTIVFSSIIACDMLAVRDCSRIHLSLSFVLAVCTGIITIRKGYNIIMNRMNNR